MPSPAGSQEASAGGGTWSLVVTIDFSAVPRDADSSNNPFPALSPRVPPSSKWRPSPNPTRLAPAAFPMTRNEVKCQALTPFLREGLTNELASATGLGGRSRQKSDFEKVRKNVSMAVTRAIDSIRDEHLVLGRHLRNSISPGLTFRYDPERDPNWRV